MSGFSSDDQRKAAFANMGNHGHKGVHSRSVHSKSVSMDSSANTNKMLMSNEDRLNARFKQDVEKEIFFQKKPDGNYYVSVGIGMLSDTPMKYHNGSIAWDTYQVPEWVKQKIGKVLADKQSNSFTYDEVRKILNDKDFVKGVKGFGYFVEYLRPKKDGYFGKKKVTKSFATPEEAIKEAKSLQDGNSIVRVIDGTNIINHVVLGQINLHGNYSEGA